MTIGLSVLYGMFSQRVTNKNKSFCPDNIPYGFRIIIEIVDWMFAPISICWNPNSQCGGIWDKNLWEVLGVRWSHHDRVPHDVISILSKRWCRRVCTVHIYIYQAHSKKSPEDRKRRQPFATQNQAVLVPWEIYLYYLNHSVYGILFRELEPTKPLIV